MMRTRGVLKSCLETWGRVHGYPVLNNSPRMTSWHSRIWDRWRDCRPDPSNRSSSPAVPGAQPPASENIHTATLLQTIARLPGFPNFPRTSPFLVDFPHVRLPDDEASVRQTRDPEIQRIQHRSNVLRQLHFQSGPTLHRLRVLRPGLERRLCGGLSEEFV